MNPDKIIAVFGATGSQGNAVAKRLLQAGWRIRAVTRDPKSAKAQALSELGAELIMADFKILPHSSKFSKIATAFTVFNLL